MAPSPVLLAALLVSVAWGGCLFFDPVQTGPADPRQVGYDPATLKENFTRTTDLVLGLDGLAEDPYVVLEIVPEVEAHKLRHQVWFIHPTDQPSVERRANYCGEYRSAMVQWGAGSSTGALAVQQAADVDLSYGPPNPLGFQGVSYNVAPGAAYRPYFVVFGVDDPAQWAAAGADARLHVQGGAVWWRVVAEGTLTCAFQPSDYEEGTFTQSLAVTDAPAVATGLEASEHAILELMWSADRAHVQVDHNETTLLEESGSGGGGRHVGQVEAGAYTIRYRDVWDVGGTTYTGFVMRDLDMSLAPFARGVYWSEVFRGDITTSSRFA